MRRIPSTWRQLGGLSLIGLSLCLACACATQRVWRAYDGPARHPGAVAVLHLGIDTVLCRLDDQRLSRRQNMHLNEIHMEPGPRSLELAYYTATRFGFVHDVTLTALPGHAYRVEWEREEHLMRPRIEEDRIETPRGS